MSMVSTNRVTAVFESRTEAERAISALRQIGVTENELSIIAPHGEQAEVGGGGSVAHDTSDAGERIGKGALAGAGAGTLFGLAALAIPGVGPFITAGWLASLLGTAGGAIAAGAIVGGTSGALAGAFAKAGYDEHEAQYYGGAVESGGVVVAVDTSGGGVSAEQVRMTLNEYGGRAAGAAA